MTFHVSLLSEHLYCTHADPFFTLSVPPVNQTVLQGENVVFYCINNSKTFSDVTWMKDGRQHPYGGFPLDGFGPISEVLFLRSVTVDDTGLYSCGGGGREQYAMLTVIGKSLCTGN